MKQFTKEEQRANVELLISTLEKVAREYPEHFNMDAFIMPADTPKTLHNFKGENAPWADSVVAHLQGQKPWECGTAACALGWGPYATGVPIPRWEKWESYASRVFGIKDSRDFTVLFCHFNDDEEKGAAGAFAIAAKLHNYLEDH